MVAADADSRSSDLAHDDAAIPGPADRGRERVRRIALSALVALVSRVGTLLVLLVTVPMARDTLGPDRFGMWMALSSLIAVSAFADFGIGNGVLSLTARGHGDKRPETIRRAATSGVVILSGLALAGVVLLAAGYRLVDWAALFRVADPRAVSESASAVLVFGTCFALGLPASVVGRVQAGLQSGYLNDIWSGIGSIAAFAGVVAAITLHAGLPVMLAALVGLPALAQTANSIWFFARSPAIRPSPSHWHGETSRQILRLGSRFFVLQLIAVITFRLDVVIVARLFGATIAGEYAVYERLFVMVGMLAAFVINPLWPAYTEALRRRDMAWIRNAFRLSVILVPLLTAVAVLCIVLLAPYVGEVWLHTPAVALALLLGLAAWRILENTGMSLAMILNGLGMLKVQIVSASALLFIATSLKLILAPRMGTSVIPWSTSVVYCLVTLGPLIFLINRRLRREDQGDARS